MTAEIIVHGAEGSSYVQSVRLALEEKGVAYSLVPVDWGALQTPEHLTRHPFGRVPAFQHGGIAIYETQAIIRYVDEAFPGPTLQPADPLRRARMNQAIGIVENYATGQIQAAGGLNFYRAVAPKLGLPVDEAAVARAIPKARACLAAFESLFEGPFFAGETLGLADLMIAPILFVLESHADGRSLLAEAPAVAAWLQRFKQRPSARRILTLPF